VLLGLSLVDLDSSLSTGDVSEVGFDVADVLLDSLHEFMNSSLVVSSSLSVLHSGAMKVLGSTDVFGSSSLKYVSISAEVLSRFLQYFSHSAVLACFLHVTLSFLTMDMLLGVLMGMLLSVTVRLAMRMFLGVTVLLSVLHDMTPSFFAEPNVMGSMNVFLGVTVRVLFSMLVLVVSAFKMHASLFISLHGLLDELIFGARSEVG
jgi:hypothetical protein